ncbi:hypothetical protein [Actinomadura sp. NPDC048394]|jgi:hypothetical protein|uniref:hypothetical protein n=1 Tax=Actinomadura sp. NPDC048394 TaxID=3158223 RepID=UPI0033D29ECE
MRDRPAPENDGGMTRRRRDGSPFLRLAGWPLTTSLLCALGWWLLGEVQEKPPPNCDFGCVMAKVGWQDYLSLLLFGGGLLAFGVFVLVCLYFWVSTVISDLQDLWR